MKKASKASSKKKQSQHIDDQEEELTLDQRMKETEAKYKKKNGPLKQHDAEEWFQANIQEYEKEQREKLNPYLKEFSSMRAEFKK